MKKILLSPSLMCGNLLNLQADLKALESHGVDYLHIDIADGKFVPNIIFGFDFLTALKSNNTPRDIHLMVYEPQWVIKRIHLNPHDLVSFHIESHSDISSTLQLIKKKGAHAGLAVNPKTPINTLFPYMKQIDFIRIMCVEPGFSGSPFISSSYDKVRELYIQLSSISQKNIIIGADGAIGIEQIKKFHSFGVQLFTLGTRAIYKGKDLHRNLSHFKSLLQKTLL